MNKYTIGSQSIEPNTEPSPSPYDHDVMQNLTAAERVKVGHEYMKRPYVVEYAYPSSDRANEYGMGKAGCWFVSKFAGVGQARVKVSRQGYASRSEAEAVCDAYAGIDEEVSEVKGKGEVK